MLAGDFRDCEFCGCHTNARLRACCDAGRAADLRFAEHRGRFAVGKKRDPLVELEKSGFDVDMFLDQFQALLNESDPNE